MVPRCIEGVIPTSKWLKGSVPIYAFEVLCTSHEFGQISFT